MYKQQVCTCIQTELEKLLLFINRVTAWVNIFNRVHTGQGKLEKVREFEWSGKVRENAKVTGKSRKFWGKILPFCTAVVMLIVVELESNPPYC